MATPAERYAALDGLRGLCACLVAMMHFASCGPLFDSPLVRNGYLMLDFFFVLSGFVIAHRYGHRLRSFREFRLFMALRLGRIYPLHLAIMTGLMLLEAMRSLAAGAGTDLVRNVEAFAPPSRGLESILTNLALLHGFGIHNTWNPASWSIAVEFFAYGLFGLMALAGFAGSRLLACLAAIALGTLAVFSGPTLDVLFGWGAVRCFVGFALGVLVYRATRRSPHMPGRSRAGTLQELALMAIVIGFVSMAGQTVFSFLAPLVFAIAVDVFARERGAISRLLCSGMPTRLGHLSYSIYMIHMPLQFLLIKALHAVEKRTGWALTMDVYDYGPMPIRFVGPAPEVGTAAYALMLALLVLCAMATRRWIELPGQRLARRLIERGNTPENVAVRV